MPFLKVCTKRQGPKSALGYIRSGGVWWIHAPKSNHVSQVYGSNESLFDAIYVLPKERFECLMLE